MKRFCSVLFVSIVAFVASSVESSATGEDFHAVAAAMKARQNESGGLIVYGKISARGAVSTPCYLDGKGNFATRVVREDGVVPFRLHGGYEPLDISVKEDFQKGGALNLGRLQFKRTEKAQISGRVNLPKGVPPKKVKLQFSILNEPAKSRMENYSCLRDWEPSTVRLKPDGTFTISDASPNCLYYAVAFAEDCQPAHDFVVAGVDQNLTLNLQKRETIKMPFGMEFVRIPPGRFIMGGSIHLGTSNRWIDVKRPFYMSRTQLTRSHLEIILGRPNSGSQKPTELSGEFAGLLQTMTKLGRRQFRLPKDYQWEYVARGGSLSGPFNVPRKDLYKYEVFGSKSLMDVGSKEANQYGVFDMIGNATEATDESHRGGWHNSHLHDLQMAVFTISPKSGRMDFGENEAMPPARGYRFVFYED